MERKRYRILRAVEHNWGLCGPDSWFKVKWLIFSDGSYELVASFAPGADAWKDDEKIPKPVKKRTSGRMDEESFAKMRKAMMNKPWRDPSREVRACDGVAWEIESFKEDGSVENTSGKLGYIYGERVLETIVSMLPPDKEISVNAELN